MNKETMRFWILISIVAISGFSQGMLLPLIAIIFENDGISSSLNGLNATGLYIESCSSLLLWNIHCENTAINRLLSLEVY